MGYLEKKLDTNLSRMYKRSLPNRYRKLERWQYKFGPRAAEYHWKRTRQHHCPDLITGVISVHLCGQLHFHLNPINLLLASQGAVAYTLWHELAPDWLILLHPGEFTSPWLFSSFTLFFSSSFLSHHFVWLGFSLMPVLVTHLSVRYQAFPFCVTDRC